VKEAAVRRYLNSDASFSQVASEVGCCVWSVKSWVGVARKHGGRVKSQRPDDRDGDEKIALLIEAASLSGDELGAFLRSNGLHDGDLKRWRADAAKGLSGLVATTGGRRLRELERENKKVKKRLREAEALLELQKKVQALWADEDDDTVSS